MSEEDEVSDEEQKNGPSGHDKPNNGFASGAVCRKCGQEGHCSMGCPRLEEGGASPKMKCGSEIAVITCEFREFARWVFSFVYSYPKGAL